MTDRIHIDLPNDETGFVDISNNCKEAVVTHLTENPGLTMAEASREVLGLDITKSSASDDE